MSALASGMGASLLRLQHGIVRADVADPEARIESGAFDVARRAAKRANRIADALRRLDPRDADVLEANYAGHHHPALSHFGRLAPIVLLTDRARLVSWIEPRIDGGGLALSPSDAAIFARGVLRTVRPDAESPTDRENFAAIVAEAHAMLEAARAVYADARGRDGLARRRDVATVSFADAARIAGSDPATVGRRAGELLDVRVEGPRRKLFVLTADSLLPHERPDERLQHVVDRALETIGSTGPADRVAPSTDPAPHPYVWRSQIGSGDWVTRGELLEIARPYVPSKRAFDDFVADLSPQFEQVEFTAERADGQRATWTADAVPAAWASRTFLPALARAAEHLPRDRRGRLTTSAEARIGFDQPRGPRPDGMKPRSHNPDDRPDDRTADRSDETRQRRREHARGSWPLWRASDATRNAARRCVVTADGRRIGDVEPPAPRPSPLCVGGGPGPDGLWAYERMPAPLAIVLGRFRPETHRILAALVLREANVSENDADAAEAA